MRNKSCGDVVRSVSEAKSKPLFMGVKVELRLNGFTSGQDIFNCIESRSPFGLKGEDGFVVFTPANLGVCQIFGKEVTIFNSPSESQFLEVIKLMLISYREFIPAKQCLDYIEAKRLTI